MCVVSIQHRLCVCARVFCFQTNYMSPFPVPEMSLSDANTKRHDIGTWRHMLSLHKHLATAKTPHEKKSLETQIGATDRQIDALVYELYGLTRRRLDCRTTGTNRPRPIQARGKLRGDANGEAKDYRPTSPARRRHSRRMGSKNARRLDLIERKFARAVIPRGGSRAQGLQDAVIAYFPPSSDHLD